MSKIHTVNDTFCITFVGARGVGKTSLLASMYRELQKEAVSCFCIDSESDGGVSLQVLGRTHEDMLKAMSAPIGEIISTEQGISGTTEPRNFTFRGQGTITHGEEKKLFHFPFRFTDLPGGWYIGKSQYGDSTDGVQKISDALNRSMVSFLSVDTPALMSGDPYLMNEFNRLGHIQNCYTQLAAQLASNKHTVIIVLSRCETYVKDPQLKEKLEITLKEKYGALINVLRNAGCKVKVTWIESLGGVEFVRYKDKCAQFKRTGAYAPNNCATPLIMALDAIYDVRSEELKELNKNWWQRFKNFCGIEHKDLEIKAIEVIRKEICEKLNINNEIKI